MTTRARHFALTLGVGPGLLLSPRRRALFARMRGFLRALPNRLVDPLLESMSALDSRMEPTTVHEAAARRLADVAALVDRRSPLGLCLRRSLARHHFLRAAGVPVAVHFGAKLAPRRDGDADSSARTLTGHAWTAVDGIPYHERASDYAGFTTMLVWPDPTARDG